jgi:hypothetical protein
VTVFKADVYGFFFHSLPDKGTLTLEELHNLIADVWLKRFDEELETERAARRKGRPKSTKEVKIEDMKGREEAEYRTGMGAEISSSPLQLVMLIVNAFRGYRLDPPKKH